MGAVFAAIMLRASRRFAVHYGMSAETGRPVYMSSSGSFWLRWAENFRRRSVAGKAASLVGYAAMVVGVYLATSIAVRVAHQPSVDRLFEPGIDYTLEEWAAVEPTLRPGDIILMRGSGLMSWTITTLQFLHSWMRPSALRYSHVAVVVAPAVVEYVPEAEAAAEAAASAASPCYASSLEEALSLAPPAVSHAPAAAKVEPSSWGFGGRRGSGPPSVAAVLEREEAELHRQPVVRRGALILEAMDNKDYHVPDVCGVVRYDAVQVVEASRRLSSVSADGTAAYSYFSVRRLRQYSHSAAQQSTLVDFCCRNVGRPMDGSFLLPLAFLRPSWHSIAHPHRGRTSADVSCSELVVELYQALSILQRRWTWVPLQSTAETAAAAVSTSTAATPLPLSTASPLKERGEWHASLQLLHPAAPSPTSADVIDCRDAKSLHVSDYSYGGIANRTSRPLVAPRVGDAEVIDGGAELAAPLLRHRSSTAPMQPVWPSSSAGRSGAAHSGQADYRPLPTAGEMEEMALRQEPARSREEATFEYRPGEPLIDLYAGDIARDIHGGWMQLQWHYKHCSTATAPYHFTEGADKRVLDFALNMSLGPEIFMKVPRSDAG